MNCQLYHILPPKVEATPRISEVPNYEKILRYITYHYTLQTPVTFLGFFRGFFGGTGGRGEGGRVQVLYKT